MKAIQQLLRKWETCLLLLLIFEICLFGLLSPGFLQLDTFLYSFNDFSYIALAAIPMTFVIITGGIDVSVGSIMGLSSITLGVLWSGGMNIWLALCVALLVAVAAGGINGMLVAYTNVQPLVVTLGGMFLFSGIALVVSGGSNASGYEGISGFPNSFVEIAGGQIVGIPYSILAILISICLFGFLLHFTRYGRKVFLVGINIKAAQYSGIRTKGIILSTYVLAGLGAGISGIILSSYFSSSRSDLGAEAVLPVITAVVLGGTSITGGKGTVIGTALASVVIGILQYGLQMTGMSSQETTIMVGLLLIFCILLRNMNVRTLKSVLVSNRK